MKIETRTRTNRRAARARLLFGIAVPLTAVLALAASPAGGGDACFKWSFQARQACLKEALGGFWVARAKCTNLPTAQERFECKLEAWSELKDELELCGEQLEARLEVCEDLGGGIYDVEVEPEDFVEVIDNPFLPLLPGTTWIYEKQVEGETERIEVTVLEDTKEILGVECTVVRDVVSVDGELVEDTFDWYAQDVHGNVWYFGEIALNYEDGELVDIAGSWKSGVDGAQPGIVMLADPQVGDVYRQEFLIQEAEDVAGVLSLSETVHVPYGSFLDCLQTEDYTPLEPDTLEHKFYALGVGLVLEVDPESGERTELLEVQVN